MFQNSTPWMDGVSHITQCPIDTYSSFQYIFKAIPPGTMWYHSHVGTQRTEGVFGSLVVRETREVQQATQDELCRLLGEDLIIADEPEHTISMLDWQREDIIIIAQKLLSDNPFFLFGDDRDLEGLEFAIPLGPDGAEASRIPYWAGLFNGLGRQNRVPYAQSRLSIFNVQYRDEESPLYYRFRLVGAMNRYMYRFSIAQHKLIVIATDGFLTEPMEVDYIHVHTGERYDFLLRPMTEAEANGVSDFLVLAETVESSPRIAEGFLHYGSSDDIPTSPEYESIVNSTLPRNCSTPTGCTAINCPFLRYDSDFFKAAVIDQPISLLLTNDTKIQCIPVTDLKLLFPTEDDVPSNEIDPDNEHFFDFSFIGISGSAAINGRTFVIPSGSLQTQPGQEMYKDICQLGTVDCRANPDSCICTQIIELNDPWATIQFVLSAIGDTGKTYHPVHLHGHSFQVAGIFYGEYNADGKLVEVNPNVTCNSDPSCTNPGWNSTPVDGTVNDRTVRKDTIVIPAGGYAVIRFVSDNWGYWYMHCHIEPHFLEGMAVVINEAQELQNPPPPPLARFHCGDFNWTVEGFDEALQPRTSDAPTGVPLNLHLLVAMATVIMAMVV